MPDSVSRIRLMKRPSTVVTLAFITIHATPNSGTIPSISESNSIMLCNSFGAPASCRLSRANPALAVRGRRPHDSRRDGGATKDLFVCFLSAFSPEAVPGAVNENVFQRRLAHGNCLNLTRKRLDHICNKA